MILVSEKKKYSYYMYEKHIDVYYGERPVKQITLPADDYKNIAFAHIGNFEGEIFVIAFTYSWYSNKYRLDEESLKLKFMCSIKW